MVRRKISLFLVMVLLFTSIPLSDWSVRADTAQWSLDGSAQWVQAYAANNQNDYLQDQQTGSGSVSQDIVGDTSFPSIYQYTNDSEIAIRIRISDVDGGTGNADYEFKNFAFVGLDADCNGSIDFFLGAYNPSGSNGRLGIYSSTSGYANTGPSSTGISGKPLLAFQPVRGVNYTITKATDGSGFNGDDDYFVSFHFSISEIHKALSGTSFQNFSGTTAFRFIAGTASQDNSFNQDINGMNQSGWSSGSSWNSLGVYSDILSADGTANYYTVIFNKNTGDTEANPGIKAVVANSVLGTLPTSPSKRGMYFQEWNTSADGSGTKVTANTLITANMTIYAIWSDTAVSTVTFNPNGGNFSGSVSTVTVSTLDGTVGVNMPPNPTYNSKYFMGWNTASNGSGTYFNSMSSVTTNTTVYAQWVNNANKVAIFYNNYDAGGGSEVVRIYSNGNSNNFNGTLPVITRVGYTFGGWFLNDKTCGGTAVSSIGAQGSYYAKWTSASYTVTFNGNGTGVGNVPSSYSISGGIFGTLPSEPSRSGYDFVEWNRNSAGTGEAMYPSTIIESSLTVYAVWAPSKTVAFDSNGGEDGTQSILAVNGLLEYQPQPSTRSGYSFMGWATSASGTEAVDLQDVSNYTTLYAIWNQVYQVNFHVNNGSWDGTDTTGKSVGTAYGSVLYLPTDPVRNGYVFSGWNTQANGGGSDFTLNTSVSGAMTVYAQWTSSGSSYTVTFHENGGTSVTPLMTSSIATLPDTTRTGYLLNGWFTDGTFAENSRVTAPYTVAENTDLYAKWDPVEYTLDYDLAGGTLSLSNPINYDIETSGFTLNQPTRNGYTFAGWTGGGLNDPTVSVEIPLGTTGNKSYVATWAPNQYGVTFDANNGEFGDSSITKLVNQTYGATYELPSGNPVNTGYTFVSWNTNANGTGNNITSGSVVNITTAITLYAIWVPEGSTSISYSSNNSVYGNVSLSLEAISEGGDALGSQALPSTGYHFVEWQNTNGDFMSGNSLYVPQKDGQGDYTELSFIAIFAPNTNTPYQVEHYVMDTDGSYPSTPDVTDQETGTTLETLDLHNLVDADLLVTDGIEYLYGSVLGISTPSVNISGDGTLVIKLYYERLSYTLILTDGLGIESCQGDGVYYYGESVVITANLSPGYGWSMWESGNTLLLSDKATKTTTFVMPHGGLTLTAVGELNQYTLSYNLSGGSLSQSNLASYTVVTDAFTLINPTKTGYDFAGWTGGGLSSPTISVTIEKGTYGNKVYTATWRAKTFQVKYDGNIGVFLDQSTYQNITQTYGNSYLFPSENPARSGYTFASWNTQSNGAGNTITSGATFTVNGTQTLYAVWTPMGNITISYGTNNSGYGIVNLASETLNPETGTPLGAVAIPKTGYHFVAWKDGSGNTISTSTIITPEKNGNGKYITITYTAVFAPNSTTEYTIEHYLMSTKGTYGTTPSKTQMETGTTMASVQLELLADASLKVVGGIQYAYGTVNGVTTSTTTIAADGSRLIKLYYSRNQHALNLVSGTGIKRVTGAGTYYYGEQVNISATLESGYQWVQWTSNNTGMLGNQTSKNKSFLMPAGSLKLTASAIKIQKTYDIEGTIVDDDTPAVIVPGATIMVKKGTIQYGETVVTDANGEFAIHGIPDGVYNLIMVLGDKTAIVAIVVNSNEPVTQLGTIVFPLGNASSQLVLEGDDTPAIVVGNLHPQAIDYFRNEGETGFVKVEMKVKKTDETFASDEGNTETLKAINEIQGTAFNSNARIGIYLEMEIDKYQRAEENQPWNFTGNITDANGLIEVIIPIPLELQGKSEYVIYRYHGDQVNTISTLPNDEGEYLILNESDWTLTLYIKKFSVYAIAYYLKDDTEDPDAGESRSFPQYPFLLAGAVLTVGIVGGRKRKKTK